jgi:hypothetical protein
VDALEDFDRMSEKYGRAQAMRAVLLKHGRYAS